MFASQIWVMLKLGGGIIGGDKQESVSTGVGPVRYTGIENNKWREKKSGDYANVV